MRKKPTITVPGLVKELGAPTIADAVGCDRGLPNKWAKGQHPGWRNAEKLITLANDNGYVLVLFGGAK